MRTQNCSYIDRKLNKMNNQEKNNVGIWMDNHHAFIISSEGGSYVIQKKIDRELHADESYKNEHFELSKDTAELKKYFKAISDEIIHDHGIFIFGPGKVQEEFKNVLKELAQFKTKEIVLGAASKMSDKQMVAKVIAHFDGTED